MVVECNDCDNFECRFFECLSRGFAYCIIFSRIRRTSTFLQASRGGWLTLPLTQLLTLCKSRMPTLKVGSFSFSKFFNTKKRLMLRPARILRGEDIAPVELIPCRKISPWVSLCRTVHDQVENSISKTKNRGHEFCSWSHNRCPNPKWQI